MFIVSPSGSQGDHHVSQRRTRKDTGVFFFFYMGHDEPLPVSGEFILRCDAVDDYAASSLSRRDDQMHFCIVAERRKMSDSFKSI